MSVRVDLAEFLSAYVAEADEQLAIAGAKLLLVDELARREERDPRALRDLFQCPSRSSCTCPSDTPRL